jgi:ribosomal protein S18 acetylase RimI-like enzyme
LDHSVFTGEQAGYVSTVVVTAAAAGAGVGRLLMRHAEEWARQQGCRVMTLEVFGQNAAARAVYERLGYQEQTLKLAKQL